MDWYQLDEVGQHAVQLLMEAADAGVRKIDFVENETCNGTHSVSLPNDIEVEYSTRRGQTLVNAYVDQELSAADWLYTVLIALKNAEL